MDAKATPDTIYFEPALHHALQLKAAETHRSLSDLVNEAVQLSLTEDAEDLIAVEQRASEPDLSFTEFVKELKRSGKL